MAKELHIMIGGTGTGKSALAKRMKKELGLEVFCPDDNPKVFASQILKNLGRAEYTIHPKS